MNARLLVLLLTTRLVACMPSYTSGAPDAAVSLPPLGDAAPFEPSGHDDAAVDAGTPSTELCSNTCSFPRDGECDDGRPGSVTAFCDLGTDCDDCGPASGAEIPRFERRPGIYVANLVDPALERELIAFMTSGGDSLAGCSRAFLARYPDEFDFLYFVTATPRPDFAAVGREIEVTAEAIPGTGLVAVNDAASYGTSGRLKAAIGLTWESATSYMGAEAAVAPVLHETLHYWSVHLDESFGFGKTKDEDFPFHWGIASTYGQHGGFDGATLRCTRPAGATPPCMAEANGRVRYQMASFGPNANGGDSVPYSAMELYLMGLMPAEEVPSPIVVLDDAEPISFDEPSDTMIVESRPLREIPLSAIVARHGARPPATQRAFRGAFVIVSSAPASTQSMRLVEAMALIMGQAERPAGWGTLTLSFEQATGGRASFDTWIADAAR